MHADRFARVVAILGIIAILGYGGWTLWQIKRSQPIPNPSTAQDMVSG